MKKITYTIIILFISLVVFGQQPDISQMTKEDVLELSYDELLEMPFEDLLRLADIVGVSLDELYEMLLNKDVVSASKKVESSFEAPLSTSVISYDEIIASGARSVEEALRLVPGLIVREKTNGNFDVHIRGNDNLPPGHMLLYSENSITLVMIDGRPVYNYAHGGTFWETLPIGLDDIERIEVVRGPSSALYGPNAVSGAINILTKRQDSKKLNVNGNLQGGTQSTLISSLAIGKKLTDKLAFRVSGNFETMDRNTDLLYVHKANNGDGGFISKEELEGLTDSKGYNVFDPTDSLDAMIPNPYNARKRYGVNGYLFYDVNDDVAFDLKGGYQNSDIISSTMGDNPMAHVGRLSSTGYVDFNAKIHGLRVQANVLDGWQDIVRQDTGFKFDAFNFNANAEYDFNLGGLNIRPGVSYQMAKYNDMPHLRYEGQGFMNGEREINSTALSLRADYLAFEKFRLVGAVRGEKYNTHDDLYLSYQLIASYNLNKKHNFRIVHSRANRGPFLADTYANYEWNREGRPTPAYIKFNGQQNLNLLTMNMFEIGYRVKPTKKIQADFEFFYNIANDFGALYPDSVNLNVVAPPNYTENAYVSMTYTNIDLKSNQLGVSGEVTWIANKNIFVKVFGTYQVTQLTDYIPKTQDETIEDMILTALFDTTKNYSTDFPTDRESGENLATPSFYGGAVINYKFKEKLNFNLNTYFYSKQEFTSKYSHRSGPNLVGETIDSKFIINAKISYEIKPQAIIFVNVKNLLGSKNEFAYMDDIGALFLAGFTINY